jgi:hypothetical protein
MNGKIDNLDAMEPSDIHKGEVVTVEELVIKGVPEEEAKKMKMRDYYE